VPHDIITDPTCSFPSTLPSWCFKKKGAVFSKKKKKIKGTRFAGYNNHYDLQLLLLLHENETEC